MIEVTQENVAEDHDVSLCQHNVISFHSSNPVIHAIPNSTSLIAVLNLLNNNRAEVVFSLT